MLDVDYPPHMLEKVKAILRWAERVPRREREHLVRSTIGLSYLYLRRIGRDYKQPSNRTMMNLGYELFARDTTTGELVPLEMNQKCDWNPQNPKANPTSIRISEDVLGMTSTTNE